MQENQKMAEQVVTMQEKNRKMRLQLIESQTLFKEVMAEARTIILSTVESPEETDDELMLLSDMGFGSPRLAADSTGASASESEYESEDEAILSDVEETGSEQELVSGSSQGEDVPLHSAKRAVRDSSEAQLPTVVTFREPEAQAQGPSEQEGVLAQERGGAAGDDDERTAHAATPAPQEMHAQRDKHVRADSSEGTVNGADVVSLAERGQPCLTSALEDARRKTANNREAASRRMTVDLQVEPSESVPQMAAERDEATPSRATTMPVHDFTEPPPAPAAALDSGAVPAPVVTSSDAATSNGRAVRWTPAPTQVTPKNGYAPRRTSRRAPITMVPMPEPSVPTPAVATAAAAVAAASSSSALRDVDTEAYGPYETEPVGVDDDTAVQVNTASTAASLKKMLHTKAVPATEAAGALLEAQVKLEAGLDGGSSTEDLEWLTDQAESLLSVRTYISSFPLHQPFLTCCIRLTLSI